jgi:DNA-binding NtrC family response regulator
VRVIAATHCDLEQSVREEKFREDLYFRLAHLPIEVPPLRRRGADVRLLFDHFVELFTRRHRRPPRQIDADIYPHLDRHGWPGNVRELKNVCERLVVFGGDPLTADELPSSFFGEEPSLRGGAAVVRLDSSLPILALRDFKALCEKEYVERVLRRTNWNFAAAARLLEIQRTYLHQKAASLGIRRPQAEPQPAEA